MFRRRYPWREWLGLLLLAGGAGLLGRLGHWLPAPQQVFLWSLLVLAGPMVLRRFWYWLLGPLFFYDLVRTARKNRHIPLRCLYAALLAVALFQVYSGWFPGTALSDLFHSGSLQQGQVSRFAESFFSSFLAAQLMAVYLLTPFYIAGSITEEKEHRTLELLLTTELNSREIVLGILASRLANLFLLLLTGVPILCLLQFLGGVDLRQLLVGFTLTGLTLLSLGSLSILISVHARNTLTAYGIVYLLSFLFLVVSEPILELTLGNPLPAILRGNPMFGRGKPGLVIFLLCVLFHLLITLLCLSVALRHLRRVGRQEANQPAGRALPGTLAPATLPSPDVTHERKRIPVGKAPLLWKEFFLEYHTKPAPVWVFLILLLGVFPTILLFGEGRHGGSRAVAFFISLGLFLVPVRAAGAITREREQQTLETLLITPLERPDILQAKWLASILSYWWGGVVLISIIGVALFCGSIHFLALPLLILGTLVYAGFLGWLGLWFSTVCSTTLRATLLTVLAVLLILVLSWGLSRDLEARVAASTPNPSQTWRNRFLVYGLVPLRTLEVLAFAPQDVLDHQNPPNYLAALAGLLCYTAAGAGLWQWTCLIFGRQTGERSRSSLRAKMPPATS